MAEVDLEPGKPLAHREADRRQRPLLLARADHRLDVGAGLPLRRLDERGVAQHAEQPPVEVDDREAGERDRPAWPRRSPRARRSPATRGAAPRTRPPSGASVRARASSCRETAPDRRPSSSTTKTSWTRRPRCRRSRVRTRPTRRVLPERGDHRVHQRARGVGGVARQLEDLVGERCGRREPEKALALVRHRAARRERPRRPGSRRSSRRRAARSRLAPRTAAACSGLSRCSTSAARAAECGRRAAPPPPPASPRRAPAPPRRETARHSRARSALAGARTSLPLSSLLFLAGVGTGEPGERARSARASTARPAPPPPRCPACARRPSAPWASCRSRSARTAPRKMPRSSTTGSEQRSVQPGCALTVAASAAAGSGSIGRTRSASGPLRDASSTSRR